MAMPNDVPGFATSTDVDAFNPDNLQGDPSGASNLRPVQRQKFAEMQQFWSEEPHKNQRILVDMCTGSGKSGVACLAPYALRRAGRQCQRMLWLVPTIEAWAVTMKAVTGRDRNGNHHADKAFLYSRGLLSLQPNGQPAPLPRVMGWESGVYAVDDTERLIEDILQHHIVVATAQIFSAGKKSSKKGGNDAGPGKRLEEIRRYVQANGALFDLFVFDECHYLPTSSWTAVWEHCKGPNSCSIAMSATPFRTDKTHIPHDIAAARYTILQALQEVALQKCVKDICVLEVSPNAEHVGIMTPANREDDWDAIILDLLRATKDLLNIQRFRRGSGQVPHKAIGYARSEEVSRRIVSVAAAHANRLTLVATDEHGVELEPPRPMRVAFLPPKSKDPETHETTLRAFKRPPSQQGSIDLVIHAGALAEAFDYPYATIGTMFYAKPTRARLAQATGRIARAVTADQIGNANEINPNAFDNLGHVLLHGALVQMKTFREYCATILADGEQVDYDPLLDLEIAALLGGDEAVEPEEGDVQAPAPAIGEGNMAAITALRSFMAPSMEYYADRRTRFQADHAVLEWTITDEPPRNLYAPGG